MQALMSATITAVVLAAGAGSRMKSTKSKVLHRLAGRALLQYPVLAAKGAGCTRVVVVASPANRSDVSHCLTELADELGSVEVVVVEQSKPLGSGNAALAAVDALFEGPVVVINGDAPLIQSDELSRLIRAFETSGSDLAVLSCVLDNPRGYGRIVRDEAGAVVCVREQKDLRPEEETIREVNAGMYCASASFFQQHLPALQNDNAQKEYYITDLIERAVQGRGVVPVEADASSLQGVNDREQLFDLEQLLFARINSRHRKAGVTIDAQVCVDDQVRLGTDVTLRSGTCLRGNTRLGTGVLVDSGCVITNTVIEDGAVIKPYCVIEDSVIQSAASVGPFAHLRPKSVLGPDSKVGNFVEVKASALSKGAKVNHLAYVGDAEIGEHSNIGAGTIFCNYDGYSKDRTIVGNNVFVGSDSQLVAPVRIGDGSFVATGTTVTDDVPPNSLVLSRGRQTTKIGYAEGLRQKLIAKARAKKRGE
jgi:bifunctional UDP-N-acetylglucosamine pyrophosphorylase / glucosamine-1-phosphate N-acetyltransferase